VKGWYPPAPASFKPAQTRAERDGATMSQVSHFMNKLNQLGFVDGGPLRPPQPDF
jgi:hypothetical protein